MLLADDVRNTGKTYERCASLIRAAGGTVIATVQIYDRLESVVDLKVVRSAGVRVGLAAADAMHAVISSHVMQGSLDALRKVSGGTLPKWSPAFPRPVRFIAPTVRPSTARDRIVYFPSCAARNLGAQRGHDGVEPLPEVAQRLLAKAGFAVAHPERLA